MRHADPAADRRDVDDAAAAVLAHVRDGGKHRVQRSPEVRGHRLLEIRHGHVIDRTDRDHAGVVDEHVESPVPLEDVRDHALACASVATSATSVDTSMSCDGRSCWARSSSASSRAAITTRAPRRPTSRAIKSPEPA